MLAALIGMPLYLDNVAALPIVSGLLAQGMQAGAAIAFLIGGHDDGACDVGGVGRCHLARLRSGRRRFARRAVVLGWLTNVIPG